MVNGLPHEFGDMVFLATNESDAYAKRVYGHLRTQLESTGVQLPKEIGHVAVTYYPGGMEIYPTVNVSVRNKRVYLFHHCLDYAGQKIDSNIGLAKVSLIGDALRNSSPEQIIYVIPWFPYGRQERMDRPRVPISARWALRQLDAPNSRVRVRLVTYDLHAHASQGFVDYQIDNLYTDPLVHEYMMRKFVLNDMDFDKELKLTDAERAEINEELRSKVVTVAADTGAATRCRRLAKRYGGDMVMIDKRRSKAGVSEVMHVLGAPYVRGKTAFVPDDIIDTAGTQINACHALRKQGAREVYGFGAHGMLNKDKHGEPAEDRIKKSGMRIAVMDTIPRNSSYREANRDWFEVIPTHRFTGNIIIEIQRSGGSVSKYFEDGPREVRDDLRPMD